MTTELAFDPDALEPASPCIGVCVLHPQTQLCEGCLRTGDEIAAWWDATPEQKHRILTEAAARRARLLEGIYFD